MASSDGGIVGAESPAAQPGSSGVKAVDVVVLPDLITNLRVGVIYISLGIEDKCMRLLGLKGS